MAGSNFTFIKNEVLRENLEIAFDHILTLITFTSSDEFSDEAKSSFRKTVIIYTAAIIEALLFCVLDINMSEDDVAEYYSSWQLKNKKVVYEITPGLHEIIAGEYIKELGDGRKAKLNLGQIATILRDKEIINDELRGKIDIVRKMRNDQHFGPHKTIKSYSKNDLERAFSVASEVKAFVRDNI